MQKSFQKDLRSETDFPTRIMLGEFSNTEVMKELLQKK